MQCLSLKTHVLAISHCLALPGLRLPSTNASTTKPVRWKRSQRGARSSIRLKTSKTYWTRATTTWFKNIDTDKTAPPNDRGWAKQNKKNKRSPKIIAHQNDRECFFHDSKFQVFSKSKNTSGKLSIVNSPDYTPQELLKLTAGRPEKFNSVFLMVRLRGDKSINSGSGPDVSKIVSESFSDAAFSTFNDPKVLKMVRNWV